MNGLIEMHETHVHDRRMAPGPQIYPDLPQVQLEIVRGRARNRVRPVEAAAFLIGATSDCDLVLGDPRFPGAHAYLLRSRQGVSIRHLGAGPELTVNGQPVHTTSLVDGDRIRTGTFEFRIRIRWPEPLTVAPSHFEGRRESSELVRDVRAALDQEEPKLRVYHEHVASR